MNRPSSGRLNIIQSGQYIEDELLEAQFSHSVAIKVEWRRNTHSFKMEATQRDQTGKSNLW